MSCRVVSCRVVSCLSRVVSFHRVSVVLRDVRTYVCLCLRMHPSKALGSIISNPFDVVKTRLLADGSRYPSTLSAYGSWLDTHTHTHTNKKTTVLFFKKQQRRPFYFSKNNKDDRSIFQKTTKTTVLFFKKQQRRPFYFQKTTKTTVLFFKKQQRRPFYFSKNNKDDRSIFYFKRRPFYVCSALCFSLSSSSPLVD